MVFLRSRANQITIIIILKAGVGICHVEGRENLVLRTHFELKVCIKLFGAGVDKK